ncbi:MAG: flavodoxin family protein [Desulfobacterales bacterium]|jgi:multimeric flavodoxin WrbA|nr:flavodoxin family protein [Desulfobacterales bacterium]
MAKKKQNLLVVIGSPRRGGNSAALADRLAKSAAAAGAAVEALFLQELDIKPCTACEACRAKRARGCIIRDGMQPLYAKIKAADAIVVASPVYWFSLSAQTKLFMDRWYALGGGNDYRGLRGKRFALLLAYADADAFSSGAVNALHTFQDAIGYLGGTIAGMVYGSAAKAGEIRARKDLMQQAAELGRRLAAPE